LNPPHKKVNVSASAGSKYGQMGKSIGSRDENAVLSPGNEPSLDAPDLIAGYGDRLLRSAYLMCGHSNDAQDIVQETFCRALEALPDFRGEAGVYTWLFCIMRNVYLQHRRSEKRFLHFLARQPRVQYAESDQVENCERNGVQSQLLKLLQRLPAKHREIVVLRFVNDLKIADIARILSLPEGTVKSRLFKAGNRLQRLMGARCGRPLPVCEEAHEL
jgi:RNA polymerase sigma-70 factor (ECF subfamily)